MHTRYAALFTIFLVFVPVSGLLGQMVFKGLGTSNSTFLLGHTSAVHTQCLYLPVDLTPNNGGDIERLYYRYGSTGEALGNTLGDIRIRMGQTTLTGFVQDTVYFTDLTMALHQETLEIPPGIEGDWFPIELDTPFNYDPSQTLIIDIMFATTANLRFGTFGTSNDGRKLRSPDTTSVGGFTTSTAWQDMGFDLDQSTGLSFVSNSTGHSVVPNPFMEGFQVFFNEPVITDATLEVRDMSGRQVSSQLVQRGSGVLTVPGTDLPSGIYLLRMTGEDGVLFTDRIVKQ